MNHSISQRRHEILIFHCIFNISYIWIFTIRLSYLQEMIKNPNQYSFIKHCFVNKSSSKESANYGFKINTYFTFLIFSCIWCQVILIHDLMKLETLFPSILGSIKHMLCPQRIHIFTLRIKFTPCNCEAPCIMKQCLIYHKKWWSNFNYIC